MRVVGSPVRLDGKSFSQANIGSEISEEFVSGSDIDGISRLLASYQQAVVHILGQSEIPGVSANDIESFCTRSRSSAYTCGVRSCPRATIGFDSARLRDEHQIEHTRKYCCTYPSCQYPPFSSSQILKRHIRTNHTTASPRKSIRQVKDTGATYHDKGNEADGVSFPPSSSHMGTEAGPEEQGTNDDFSRQVSRLSTAIYRAEVHEYLKTRNFTEETCPPQELHKFKENCLTRAVEAVRQYFRVSG